MTLKRLAPRLLIFVAAYTFVCAAAIFFLVRSVGAIVGLVLGSNSVIAAALSQLADARISVPVWILLCGAAAVCVFRELTVKRPGGKKAVIVTATSILILLLVFAAAFLRTRVNGVFIHNTIGIIKMLLESGLL